MFLDQVQQRFFGAAQVVAGLEGINRGGVDQLAGVVHDRDLAAGPDPRIKTQRGARACGGCQQQVLEVAGKHLDRRCVGAAAQVGQQIHEHGPAQLDPPCPFCGFLEPEIARCLTGYSDFSGNDADDTWNARILIRGYINCDDVFFGGAQDGQGAVRRDRGPLFAMGEIVGKFGADFLFAGVDAGGDQGLLLHDLPQAPQQGGVFTKLFGQNIARTGQRVLLGWHGFGQITLRQHGRIGSAVGKDRAQQRFQPVFAGDHGLGSPLGLEGQIQVFKHGLGVCAGDGAGQCVSQFALSGYFRKDARAPFFQIAQIVQPFRQPAQLRIVKAACHLFAIARDEGHGIATIQQCDRGGDLFGTRANVSGNSAGNAICDGVHGGLLLVFGSS